MLLFDLILLLVGATLGYGDEYCFAEIIISNKFDDSFQNLHLSGLYSFQSQTDKITGRLLLANSYSFSNQTQIVSNGCSSYSNEPITYEYISIVEQGDCSIDDKIEYAIKSNALGLIVISQNSQIFKIKNSKSNIIVNF